MMAVVAQGVGWTGREVILGRFVHARILEATIKIEKDFQKLQLGYKLDRLALHYSVCYQPPHLTCSVLTSLLCTFPQVPYVMTTLQITVGEM